MADRVVNPGAGTIQAMIAGAAASGDRLLLQPGTYTHSGFTGIDFYAVAKQFNSLRIVSDTPGAAIIDFSGMGSGATCIKGRSAADNGAGGVGAGWSENITWEQVVFKGNPPGASVYHDDTAANRYKGWEWHDIQLDGMSVRPFAFVFTPSISMSWKGVTTLSTFAATEVISVFNPTSSARLDMMIRDVDARLHTAALDVAVKINSAIDVRIKNVSIADCLSYGIQVAAGSFAGNGGVSAEVIMSNIDIDTCTSTGILLDAANTSLAQGGIVRDCVVSGFNIRNCGRGIELDTEVATVTEGVNYDNTIVGGIITDVIGAGGFGIGFATNVENNHAEGIRIERSDTGIRIHGSRDNTAQNITLVDCQRAIYISQYAGSTTARNLVGNVSAINCEKIYEVTDSGSTMPTNENANRLGPNLFTTATSSFALVDSAPKTQAEFEALFPASIVESDEVISFGTPLYNTYSTQQALNILAGEVEAPYTKYSSQAAANRLIGSPAGNPNMLSTQAAFNFLLK